MGIVLKRITEDDLELLMNWRMSDSVTKYMNTNPRLTIDMQREWFEAQEHNDRVRNWIVEVDNTKVGLINLIDMDFEKRITSWGYYIGEESYRSLRLAISLEMSLYDYCFDVLGLKEVNSETFKLNEGVWKLHIACGCSIVKEVEGEIEKDGVRYDIVHMSMDRDKWLSIREKKMYDRINFDIWQDKIYGMIVHHLGVATSDIMGSVRLFEGLGWKWDGQIIEDNMRNVRLAFLKHCNDELLELVCPVNDKSPINNTLDNMKNIASPYHICYEVDNIESVINILKKRRYVVTDTLKAAVAFNERRVVFLLNKDVGLIELLEKG